MRGRKVKKKTKKHEGIGTYDEAEEGGREHNVIINGGKESTQRTKK